MFYQILHITLWKSPFSKYCTWYVAIKLRLLLWYLFLCQKSNSKQKVFLMTIIKKNSARLLQSTHFDNNNQTDYPVSSTGNYKFTNWWCLRQLIVSIFKNVTYIIPLRVKREGRYQILVRKKHTHTVPKIFESASLPDCPSVTNFDPNYLRTGLIEWAEIF